MQSNSLNRSVTRFTTGNQSVISSRIIGVLVLIFVEIMFFSALLSSFFVMKRGRELWNTAGSIQLPVLATGFNTVVLLSSGLFLFLAGKALKNSNGKLAGAHLFRAIALGGFFLAFQSYLGVQMINSGLTISSSVFAGCFHLLIGIHLMQVVLGIFFMIKIFPKINSAKFGTDQNADQTLQDQFNSLQVFWLFIMGIWPVIYAEVYF